MTLDLVIPAYNEERRIGRTLRSYSEAFAGTDARIHVALDGCRDATAEVVRDHAADDPRIDLFDFPKLGKGGVLMEAFRRCDGDLVGFVDADCATPPSELAALVEATEHADGAIASRRHPSAITPGPRPLSRRLASAGFASGIRHLFHLPYSDTQCGAKVLRREVVDAVVPLLSSRDFLFDVDLLVVADRLGYRITEVPTVWVDQGESKLHALADSRRMMASALRLWVHHRTLPIDRSPHAPIEHPPATSGAEDIGRPLAA
ncbi:MAG: glycosyltransferase [Acidimicrobiales bacterium]